jgi:hypothetical protein
LGSIQRKRNLLRRILNLKSRLRILRPVSKQYLEKGVRPNKDEESSGDEQNVPSRNEHLLETYGISSAALDYSRFREGDIARKFANLAEDDFEDFISDLNDAYQVFETNEAIKAQDLETLRRSDLNSNRSKHNNANRERNLNQKGSPNNNSSAASNQSSNNRFSTQLVAKAM